MSAKLKVRQFAAGSCYSYILNCQSEAFIIDPHISLPEEYIGYLDKHGLTLKYIVDTHTHADHFSLAAILKERFKAPVLMHERAMSEVADRRLKEGDEISIGPKHFKILYAPGHTDDTINIYGEGMIFTADVLLIGSVGRTDFQNGSPESMFDTLEKLRALPDETIVFPVHDYNGRKSSTIGREKARNPFMRERNKEAFVRNARSKKLPKPFNIDNIIRVNQKGQARTLEMVSPKEAQEVILRDEQVKLLDVRSPLEFHEVHIKDSLNVPIDTIGLKLKDLSESGKSYIVLCRTGNRSPMAADMLLQSGLHTVKVMQGGMTRWQKERLPVIKGEGGVSLERQVRFTAGAVVLFGIIMSWFVNRAFIWIPIGVSCGLIFSGLSDNCLLSALLMRLPYNKKLYKTKTGGGTCSISQ
ncbi:MAG: MBL fold metallo-hydrolase [Candidatus Omnitrophota bacterium]|nr:MAG: MBL fold metallo-hydrolase [Candidatus Omnitrophota bacterium]